MGRPRKREVAVNESYGRWLVVGPRYLNEAGQWMAPCRCECGREKAVSVASLVTGASRSCGCLNAELCSARMRTHGHSGGKVSPEYHSWQHAKDRCYNPKNPKYHRYGGRGIRMCERWRNSFEAFLADMGPKPSPRHTLDRKNNDGNYDPATNEVRWATPKEQARNRACVRRWSVNGETHCPGEWAEISGIKYHTLDWRRGHGRSQGHLLATVRGRMLTINGETRSQAEWGRLGGRSESTIRHRLAAGWPPEEAVFRPPLAPAQAGACRRGRR